MNILDSISSLGWLPRLDSTHVEALEVDMSCRNTKVQPLMSVHYRQTPGSGLLI